MIRFMLLGKTKDVFSEVEFMLQLQRATGHVLITYQPGIENYSQN